MKKKVLMCPPTYYDIEYEINPWMHVGNKVDKEKVQDEYERLKSVYKELGAEILELIPSSGLPDQVYAANVGTVKGKLFIKSNFKYPQRREEADVAKKFFENLEHTVSSLPENITFEGQGDLLFDGSRYFLGYGYRTDSLAKEFLETFLKQKITILKHTSPYFYHLDMSFGPLNSKTVVINPRAFHRLDVERIKELFPFVIETTKEDDAVMACNIVVVKDAVVLGKGISDHLKSELDKYGFYAKEVPMEEYRKGGGSVKCLTLEFF